MWRLFAPLKYLTISHPEKIKFDLYIPIGIGLVLSSPLLLSGFRNDPSGTLDLIERTSNFLGILTGFFIAALAAVATFGKAEMDDPMPGDPPVQLAHKANKERYQEDLSRRRFLSFLFGYLSFITLLSYLFSGGFYILDKYLLVPDCEEYRTQAFVIFWLMYAFVIGNIMSNTLLGLFYLTDRIHRPNRTLRTPDNHSSSSTRE